MPSNSKLYIKKNNSFSAPLIFVIIVFAVIFIMSISFRISNIQVVGNEHYTDEEIIKAIDIEEGDNLFFFDRFAAVSRVFAKLPYVEEVSITRHLPNKVTIEVSESSAMAYIKIGSELWTFDHNCKLLGKASGDEETQLIQVIGFNPGTLYIGETLNQDDGNFNVVDCISEILNQIQDRNISSINDIDVSDMNQISFRYGEKYKVIIGPYSDIEGKFAIMVSAISKLKDGDIGIIDISNGNNCRFTPY